MTRHFIRPVRPDCSEPTRSGAMRRNVFAVTFMLGLAACGTRGNGEVGTAERTVEAFHGVDVSGVFVLEASEGSPSVQLEGDANLLPLVDTHVDGGILHVAVSPRISPALPLVVRVRTPELRVVDVSGAASAKIATGQPKFELDASGASEVSVEGAAQNFELDVSGASEVDAAALVAAHVKVEASGASNAAVTATQSVDAEASGASEITFSGPATDIRKDVSGAASIVARER